MDHVRTKQAKAELPSPSSSIAVGAVLKDAFIRHYGSLKATAITLEMDNSQLTRDLDHGSFNLKRLDKCDADAKAFIMAALHDEYASTDPKIRIQRRINDLRRAIDALAEELA